MFKFNPAMEGKKNIFINDGHGCKVGAALIKKYSSYRKNQKKVPRVFSQKLVLGDLKLLRQVADASPILADFVDLHFIQNRPPWR